MSAISEVSDFFRETGDLTLQIPALPRPTLEELKKNFHWIGSIERDTSPTEAVTLRLGTILKPNEDKVDGAEYERRLRLAPNSNLCLGHQQAAWLVEHRDEFPELMALLGKVYIDFLGLVVVLANGNRDFQYLHRDGERCYLDWLWIDSGLDRHGRLAVSCK